jgi:hypothetical protein
LRKVIAVFAAARAPASAVVDRVDALLDQLAAFAGALARLAQIDLFDGAKPHDSSQAAKGKAKTPAF